MKTNSKLIGYDINNPERPLSRRTAENGDQVVGFWGPNEKWHTIDKYVCLTESQYKQLLSCYRAMNNDNERRKKFEHRMYLDGIRRTIPFFKHYDKPDVNDPKVIKSILETQKEFLEDYQNTYGKTFKNWSEFVETVFGPPVYVDARTNLIILTFTEYPIFYNASVDPDDLYHMNFVSNPKICFTLEPEKMKEYLHKQIWEGLQLDSN